MMLACLNVPTFLEGDEETASESFEYQTALHFIARLMTFCFPFINILFASV